MRSAPFTVSAPLWQHKFFASDVAQALRQQNQCQAGGRAATAVYALLVSSLAARVVEEAAAIKENAPEYHTDAQIHMQSSKQDSGWDKTKTRGSGVVFNDAGKRLFEAAVEQVSSRIECVPE